jgi:hypothetical protein
MAINLRHISEELHQKLNVRAATEKVTLESLCVRFLWAGLDDLGDLNGSSDEKAIGDDPEPKSERAGDDVPVPVLSKAKGRAKRLRAVQPLRGELAGRGGSDEEPIHRTHEGCRIVREGSRSFCVAHRVYVEVD